MSRLTPLAPEQLTDAQKQVYDAILASRGNLTGPFAAWLHSPELANRTQHLGEYVRFHTALPPALGELAILRVARHFDCELEWAIHEPIARQQGLTVGVIDAVFAGQAILDGTPELRAVDRYVVELLRTNHVSTSTFQQAVALLGEASVVELTILIGYYTLVAFSINAFLLPVPSNVITRLAWDGDGKAGNQCEKL